MAFDVVDVYPEVFKRMVSSSSAFKLTTTLGSQFYYQLVIADGLTYVEAAEPESQVIVAER